MNKLLVFAGITVVVASKVVLLKSILVDAPAYEACLATIPAACGPDPFVYFIAGWSVTIAGFIMIIFGLKMPATRSISR